MAYSAWVIAGRFLGIARDKAKPLRHMKLQKLVYFAHGWRLALSDGESLITDRVEAWQFGPVIRVIYQKFKGFGGNPIDDGVMEESVVDEATNALLEKIWEVYGDYNGAQLSNLSHAKGSPWEQIYDHRYRGAIIPKQLIKEYFKEQMSV